MCFDVAFVQPKRSVAYGECTLVPAGGINRIRGMGWAYVWLMLPVCGGFLLAHAHMRLWL